MSSKDDLESLFQAGAGIIPPYLAGRNQEKEFFKKRVRDLANGRSIVRDMIVYGPRGNGKTVLLRSLQKKIGKGHPAVSSAWMTPDKIKTPRMLFERIAASGQKGGQWFKQLSGNIQVAGAGVGFSMDRDREWGLVDTSIAVRELCEQTPFVLIIDEAHTLEPEVARDLLNTSQEVRGEGGAFFLVLAGTPGIKKTLSRAGASFWSRNELFPISRLSAAESREALAKPLQDYHITFAPGVVENVIERAQRYPFFLQAWGEALCTQLQPGDVIDAGHVQAVGPAVNLKRNRMYADRYNELRFAGYLDLARHLVPRFRENGPVISENILWDDVKAYCRKAGKDEGETIQGLEALGYIWQVDGDTPAYEAGIPSLMDYVGKEQEMRRTLDIGM
ncbi:MAG: ATP-binding protein [Gammaproteobacteria bacterium]|nr:ATP-binding protein [Gammaproteobacteria bacterium]